MVDVGRAVAFLDLDATGFSAGLGRANTELNTFSSTTATKGEKIAAFGRGLSSVGTNMSKFVTLPILAASVAVAKFAIDFEKGIAKVSTVADMGITSVSELGNGIKEMAQDVGYSTGDLSEGLYQVISATNDTANAMSYLDIASQLAKGGFTDVETAVDGATSVMNAYGDQSEAAFQKVSDIMITTQNVGKTTVNDLAGYVGMITPYSAALGVGFDQVGASLATLTANGLKTRVAVTQIKSAFSELAKDGQVASDNFIKATGQSFKKFIASGGNFQQALVKMGDYAETQGLTIMDMFGSIEGASAALTLTSESGAEKFNSSLEAMQDSAGATEEAYETMSNTLSGQFDRLKSSGQVLAVSFGQALMPVIESLFSMFQNLFDRINSLDDGTKRMIVTLGLTVAAIGPVLVIAGQLIVAYQRVSTAVATSNLTMNASLGVIGLVAIAIVGIIALVSSWKTHTEELTATHKEKFQVQLDETREAIYAEAEALIEAKRATRALTDEVVTFSEVDKDFDVTVHTEDAVINTDLLKDAIGHLLTGTGDLEENLENVNVALGNYGEALKQARWDEMVDDMFNKVIPTMQELGYTTEQITTYVNEQAAGYSVYSEAVDGYTSATGELFVAFQDGSVTVAEFSPILDKMAGEFNILGDGVLNARDGFDMLTEAQANNMFGSEGYDAAALQTAGFIAEELTPAVENVAIAYDEYTIKNQAAMDAEDAAIAKAAEVKAANMTKYDAITMYMANIEAGISAVEALKAVEANYGTESTQAIKDAFWYKGEAMDIGYTAMLDLQTEWHGDALGADAIYTGAVSAEGEKRIAAQTAAQSEFQSMMGENTTNWSNEEIEEFARLAEESGYKLDEGFVDMLLAMNDFANDSGKAFNEAGEFDAEQFDAGLQTVFPFLDQFGIDVNGEGIDVGYDMSTGLATGIKDGEWAAIEAAKRAVRAAIRAAQREADTASPSKETEKLIGLPMIQGVGVGFEKGTPLVVAQAQLGVRKVIDAGTDEAKESYEDIIKGTVTSIDVRNNYRSEPEGTFTTPQSVSKESKGVVNYNTFELHSATPLSVVEASNEFETMISRMVEGV